MANIFQLTCSFKEIVMIIFEVKFTEVVPCGNCAGSGSVANNKKSSSEPLITQFTEACVC